MSVAAAHEASLLEVPGGEVPVLLFAGGTTGLVLLGGAARARTVLRELGEAAEASGLSALAFADEIPGDAAVAAGRAAAMLEGLGVEKTVLVGVGDDAASALRAAAGATFAAVVLVEPRARPRRARTAPRGRAGRQARTRPGGGRAGAGDGEGGVSPRDRPHHRPAPAGGDTEAGETAAMIAEATITFAVGACGDGRRA